MGTNATGPTFPHIEDRWEDWTLWETQILQSKPCIFVMHLQLILCVTMEAHRRV